MWYKYVSPKLSLQPNMWPKLGYENHPPYPSYLQIFSLSFLNFPNKLDGVINATLGNRKWNNNIVLVNYYNFPLHEEIRNFTLLVSNTIKDILSQGCLQQFGKQTMLLTLPRRRGKKEKNTIPILTAGGIIVHLFQSSRLHIKYWKAHLC